MKKVIILLICLSLILLLILSSCDNTPKDREKTPQNIEFDNTVAREYWSFDATTLAGSDYRDYGQLQRIKLNKDGNVLSIYSYERRTLETFYYSSSGKLEYSETVELYDFVDNLHISDILVDKVLYKTVYVYENGQITRGEVFNALGTPTRSYDEYEYNENGKLNTVKRYENGKLDKTYRYNGEAQPQSLELRDVSYTIEYDSDGNLSKLYTSSEAIPRFERVNITYYEGRPIKIIVNRAEYNVSYENSIAFTYDEAGNLTQKYVMESKSDVHGQSRTAQTPYYYEYDSEGRVISRLKGSGSRAEKIRLSYDENGRLAVYEYVPDEDEASLGMTAYVLSDYHESGYPAVFKYIKYGETCFTINREFDAEGRLVRIMSDQYGGEEQIFEYHQNGGLKSQKYISDGKVTTEVHVAENGNYASRYSIYGDWLLVECPSFEFYTEYITSDIYYNFTRYSTAINLGSDVTALRKTAIYPGRTVVYEYDDDFNLVNTTETPKENK